MLALYKGITVSIAQSTSARFTRESNMDQHRQWSRTANQKGGESECTTSSSEDGSDGLVRPAVTVGSMARSSSKAWGRRSMLLILLLVVMLPVTSGTSASWYCKSYPSQGTCPFCVPNTPCSAVTTVDQFWGLPSYCTLPASFPVPSPSKVRLTFKSITCLIRGYNVGAL